MKPSLMNCDGIHLRIYRVKNWDDFHDTEIMLEDNGYSTEFSTGRPEAHEGLEAVFGEFDAFSYLTLSPGIVSAVVLMERRK